MTSPTTADALEALLDQLAHLLADKLAPLLNAQAASHVGELPARRLLTLDELVQLLPAGKSPKTWKAWLYQRTRLGQIPGCHKIGGRLFFNPDLTLPAILGPDPGLDVCGEQSLHANTVRNHETEAER